MAAYIGHTVTLQLKDEGGKFCGRLISQDHVKGKIVLSKVTCISTGKKLPGTQTYYEEDIVTDSLVVTDEVTNAKIKLDKCSLNEKKSMSIERRGSKRDSPHLPVNADVQKEKFQLASFLKYLEKLENPSELPKNIVTANLYKPINELSPREEWSKVKKGVRPTSYIIIDELGKQFDEAIYRIKAEDTIGVAFTGINIGRYGQLCWIQVATSDLVYMFDVCAMGHACISYGLGDVFASQRILKVIHDCRWISDFVFHNYDMKIINVFDTQVAAVLAYRVRHGGDLPAYVKSLQTLVEDYLPLEEDEYHVYKIRQAFKDTEEQLWSTRPLHGYLLDSLAKTASYLVELRQPLLNEMMSDFFVAMDSYVSMIRDQTDAERRLPQQEPHHLPHIFKYLQRRDMRRSVSERLKDEADQVNPHGFVENIDYPKEIVHRRDSICHDKSKLATKGVVKQHKPVAQRYVVPSYLEKELPKNVNSGSSKSSTTSSTASRPLKLHANSSSGQQSSSPADSPKKQSRLSLGHSPKKQSGLSADSPQKQSSVPSSCSSSQSELSKKFESPLLESDSGSSCLSTTLLSNNTSPDSRVGHSSVGSTPPMEQQARAVDGAIPSPGAALISSPLSPCGRNMSGVIGNARRGTSVGRGRSPILHMPATGKLLQKISSDDSDSGVDSGPRFPATSNPYNHVGVTAGFQNLEMMGSAPIRLDNIPEGFDLRSASYRDLKLLQQGKLKSQSPEEPKLLDASPKRNAAHIPVIRQVIHKDGSIKDQNSGQIVCAPSVTDQHHTSTHLITDPLPLTKFAHRISENDPQMESVGKESDSDIEWDD